MDDWSYPTPDADEASATQAAQLTENWRVFEARRIRTQQSEAACRADFERVDVSGALGAPSANPDVALPLSGSAATVVTF